MAEAVFDVWQALQASAVANPAQGLVVGPLLISERRNGDATTPADERAAAARASMLPYVDEVASMDAFTVSLSPGENDSLSSHFVQDLFEYSARYSVDAALELLVYIPADFPTSPPCLRLLSPMIQPGSGPCVNGFLIAPWLLPAGWMQNADLSTALAWYKQTLFESTCRVQLESRGMANLPAFAATRHRLLQRPSPALRHAHAFSAKYRVLSAMLATSVMGIELPEGFGTGNKCLFPAAALHSLSWAHRDGTGDTASDALVAGGFGDAGGGAFGDGAAMVFEMVSAVGHPVYVGVKEFTCPHPEVVIVPDAILAALAAPDGSNVTVTRVQLPAVQSIGLQPLSSDFEAVEAFTDADARVYLEASLLRFASLAVGEVIECDGGPPGAMPTDGSGGLLDASMRFSFTVLSVTPDSAPAVALWANFAATVPISLAPAADTYGLPVSSTTSARTPVAGPATVRGRTDAGAVASDGGASLALRPDMAAMVFGAASGTGVTVIPSEATADVLRAPTRMPSSPVVATPAPAPRAVTTAATSAATNAAGSSRGSGGGGGGGSGAAFGMRTLTPSTSARAHGGSTTTSGSVLSPVAATALGSPAGAGGGGAGDGGGAPPPDVPLDERRRAAAEAARRRAAAAAATAAAAAAAAAPQAGTGGGGGGGMYA